MKESHREQDPNIETPNLSEIIQCLKSLKEIDDLDHDNADLDQDIVSLFEDRQTRNLLSSEEIESIAKTLAKIGIKLNQDEFFSISIQNIDKFLKFLNECSPNGQDQEDLIRDFAILCCEYLLENNDTDNAIIAHQLYKYFIEARSKGINISEKSIKCLYVYFLSNSNGFGKTLSHLRSSRFDPFSESFYLETVGGLNIDSNRRVISIEKINEEKLKDELNEIINFIGSDYQLHREKKSYIVFLKEVIPAIIDLLNKTIEGYRRFLIIDFIKGETKDIYLSVIKLYELYIPKFEEFIPEDTTQE